MPLALLPEGSHAWLAIFGRSPLIFALCALAETTCGAPSENQERRNEAIEIRAVLRAQQEAWNRGDIDGFMNGYARSKSTTFVSEDKITRGWETVRDRYKKKYPDRAKMGILNFSNLEIIPLGENAATVLGRWRLNRTQDQPHGRFTLIFRLTNDGWRIVHDHTSAASPK